MIACNAELGPRALEQQDCGKQIMGEPFLSLLCTFLIPRPKSPQRRLSSLRGSSRTRLCCPTVAPSVGRMEASVVSVRPESQAAWGLGPSQYQLPM